VLRSGAAAKDVSSGFWFVGFFIGTYINAHGNEKRL
jgi:hypothetical protein